MNRDAKRLLHGLYWNARRRQEWKVGAESARMLWLIQNRIPKTRNWIEPEVGLKAGTPDEMEERIRGNNQPLQTVETALEILRTEGYIQGYRSRDELHIELTPKGVELAQKLDSWVGRLDLWYREHREGLGGLLVTVAVAAIVAWFTVWLRTS